MKYFAIIILFILGLIFCMSYTSEDFREGFDSGNCPNLLIQKGTEIHLVNTNKAEVPGVNPITFKNLEDYVEYMEWMKANNIDCPVLYLQQTYNTQGERGYRILQDPLDPQAGLPSNMDGEITVAPLTKLSNADRDEPPYNSNNFPGFDPQNQYNGLFTPLDQIECTKESGADNPMCDNWNPDIAQDHLLQGKYLKRTRPDADGKQGKNLFDINLGINTRNDKNSLIADRNSVMAKPFSRANPITKRSNQPMRGKTQMDPGGGEGEDGVDIIQAGSNQNTPQQRALGAD